MSDELQGTAEVASGEQAEISFGNDFLTIELCVFRDFIWKTEAFEERLDLRYLEVEEEGLLPDIPGFVAPENSE